MELLIVLGLCFGAYELLGVFQGCFHNDHPPHQPSLHCKEKNNNKIRSNLSEGPKEKEDKNYGDENDDNNDDEQLSEKNKNIEYRECCIVEKKKKSKTAIEECHNFSWNEKNALNGFGEKQNEKKSNKDINIEETIEELCNCCSSTLDFDEFENNDKRIILKNKNKSIIRKNHPINKFTISSSLMSLNRDDFALFNFFENGTVNGSSYKFSKFKSETEVFETSFSKCTSLNNPCNNDIINKKKFNNFLSTDKKNIGSNVMTVQTYNETNIKNCNQIMDKDDEKKKIFFISDAS